MRKVINIIAVLVVLTAVAACTPSSVAKSEKTTSIRLPVGYIHPQCPIRAVVCCH
jgi:hypothetical protein